MNIKHPHIFFRAFGEGVSMDDIKISKSNELSQSALRLRAALQNVIQH